MKINFVLPFLPTKPIGGAKIMFEYANRLSRRGHEVAVFYSIKRPFKNSRTPTWLRFALLYFRSVRWFALDQRINQQHVTEISDAKIPNADATISTWWQMAFAIARLDPSKGKKINLIQDYEIWNGQVEKVHESYGLNLCHVVIAKYLAKLVKDLTGRDPAHIPNAVDLNSFEMVTAPSERNSRSVIMMYSEEPRKGSKFGLEALIQAKVNFPDLEVTFFSVYERPAELPQWIRFVRRPENLTALYNAHAIFLSPSLGEGWALPPAEAMCCGCAVICTDIGGHRDYANHQDTAILVSPESVEAIRTAVENLISNNDQRIAIATSGHNNIKAFSWDISVEKVEQLIKSK